MINLLDFLDLRDVGGRLEDLQTPVPVIDVDVIMRNATRWQNHCASRGLANRPHIKTHKIAGLARYQLALGASGITVQKLGEAEAMADAGITDMLLTFNIVGAPKLKRLAAVMRRGDISVVADNIEMLAGLNAAAADAGRILSVLVECDTGAGRNGVQSPQGAVALACAIASRPNLKFGGLMTYPAAGQRVAAEAFLALAKQLCEHAGLAVATVTSGGSPDMWSSEGLDGITEYRVGTYIYFDRSLVARNVCGFEDCALRVLTTIVSLPTDERAIVDAGTKALTSDLLGLQGLGVVRELDHAVVYAANEEHGFVDLRNVIERPKLGQLVHIVPNHVCPVSNLFDEVVFVRGKKVLGAARVTARGLVQ